MTRKTKKENETLIQVNLRLTLEEEKKVLSYAQAAGLSRCRWIKKKIFSSRFPAIKQLPAQAALYRGLQQIGADLNLLIRRQSAGTSVVLERLVTIQKSLLKTLLP